MITQYGCPSLPSSTSAPEEAPECVEASSATGPALVGGGRLSGLSRGQAKEA